MKNVVIVTVFLVLGASFCLSGQVYAASTTKPVTIDFDGVPDGALTLYQEHGFGVRSREPGSWMGSAGYGNPEPFIEFSTPAGTKSTKSVLLTHGGRDFTFQSVDIYSSITVIPYKFRGILAGMTKYVVTGTVPNTFGNFANVKNPNANVTVDKVVISITNPLTACCSNPEGIDNIKVKPVAASVANKPQ